MTSDIKSARPPFRGRGVQHAGELRGSDKKKMLIEHM
jgi:hypothetical protein